MIKYLLTIFFILVIFVSNSQAVLFFDGTVIPSCVFKDTFEGVIACGDGDGCDNAGWNYVGPGGANVIDFDFTDGPISDEEYLKLRWFDSINPVEATTPNFTVTDDGWYSFPFSFVNYDSSGSNQEIVSFFGAAGPKEASIFYTPAGLIRIDSKGVSLTSSNSFDIEDCLDSCRFWVNLKKGSGADAEFTLYISLTDTRPASPEVQILNGGSTESIRKVRYENKTKNNILIEEIIIATTELGSNPTCIE